jgi:hypothetical protein
MKGFGDDLGVNVTEIGLQDLFVLEKVNETEGKSILRNLSRELIIDEEIERKKQEFEVNGSKEFEKMLDKFEENYFQFKLQRIREENKIRTNQQNQQNGELNFDNVGNLEPLDEWGLFLRIGQENDHNDDLPAGFNYTSFRELFNDPDYQVNKDDKLFIRRKQVLLRRLEYFFKIDPKIDEKINEKKLNLRTTPRTAHLSTWCDDKTDFSPLTRYLGKGYVEVKRGSDGDLDKNNYLNHRNDQNKKNDQNTMLPTASERFGITPPLQNDITSEQYDNYVSSVSFLKKNEQKRESILLKNEQNLTNFDENFNFSSQNLTQKVPVPLFPTIPSTHRKIYRIKTKHEYPTRLDIVENTIYWGNDITNAFLSYDYAQFEKMKNSSGNVFSNRLKNQNLHNFEHFGPNGEIIQNEYQNVQYKRERPALELESSPYFESLAPLIEEKYPEYEIGEVPGTREFVEKTKKIKEYQKKIELEKKEKEKNDKNDKNDGKSINNSTETTVPLYDINNTEFGNYQVSARNKQTQTEKVNITLSYIFSKNRPTMTEFLRNASDFSTFEEQLRAKLYPNIPPGQYSIYKNIRTLKNYRNPIARGVIEEWERENGVGVFNQQNFEPNLQQNLSTQNTLNFLPPAQLPPTELLSQRINDPLQHLIHGIRTGEIGLVEDLIKKEEKNLEEKRVFLEKMRKTWLDQYYQDHGIGKHNRNRPGHYSIRDNNEIERDVKVKKLFDRFDQNDKNIPKNSQAQNQALFDGVDDDNNDDDSESLSIRILKSGVNNITHNTVFEFQNNETGQKNKKMDKNSIYSDNIDEYNANYDEYVRTSTPATPYDALISQIDDEYIKTIGFKKSILRTISIRPKIVEKRLQQGHIDDENDDEMLFNKLYSVHNEKKQVLGKDSEKDSEKDSGQNQLEGDLQSDQSNNRFNLHSLNNKSFSYESSPQDLITQTEPILPKRLTEKIQNSTLSFLNDFGKKIKNSHNFSEQNNDINPNNPPELTPEARNQQSEFTTSPKSDFISLYRRRDTFNQLTPSTTTFNIVEKDEQIFDTNFFQNPPKDLLSQPQAARLLWILEPLNDLTPRELIDLYDLLSTHQAAMSIIPFNAYNHYEYLLYEERKKLRDCYPKIEKNLIPVAISSFVDGLTVQDVMYDGDGDGDDDDDDDEDDEFDPGFGQGWGDGGLPKQRKSNKSEKFKKSKKPKKPKKSSKKITQNLKDKFFLERLRAYETEQFILRLKSRKNTPNQFHRNIDPVLNAHLTAEDDDENDENDERSLSVEIFDQYQKSGPDGPFALFERGNNDQSDQNGRNYDNNSQNIDKISQLIQYNLQKPIQKHSQQDHPYYDGTEVFGEDFLLGLGRICDVLLEKTQIAATFREISHIDRTTELPSEEKLEIMMDSDADSHLYRGDGMIFNKFAGKNGKNDKKIKKSQKNQKNQKNQKFSQKDLIRMRERDVERKIAIWITKSQAMPGAIELPRDIDDLDDFSKLYAKIPVTKNLVNNFRVKVKSEKDQNKIFQEELLLLKSVKNFSKNCDQKNNFDQKNNEFNFKNNIYSDLLEPISSLDDDYIYEDKSSLSLEQISQYHSLIENIAKKCQIEAKIREKNAEIREKKRSKVIKSHQKSNFPSQDEPFTDEEIQQAHLMLSVMPDIVKHLYEAKAIENPTITQSPSILTRITNMFASNPSKNGTPSIGETKEGKMIKSLDFDEKNQDGVVDNSALEAISDLILYNRAQRLLDPDYDERIRDSLGPVKYVKGNKNGGNGDKNRDMKNEEKFEKFEKYQDKFLPENSSSFDKNLSNLAQIGAKRPPKSLPPVKEYKFDNYDNNLDDLREYDPDYRIWSEFGDADFDEKKMKRRIKNIENIENLKDEKNLKNFKKNDFDYYDDDDDNRDEREEYETKMKRIHQNADSAAKSIRDSRIERLSYEIESNTYFGQDGQFTRRQLLRELEHEKLIKKKENRILGLKNALDLQLKNETSHVNSGPVHRSHGSNNGIYGENDVEIGSDLGDWLKGKKIHSNEDFENEIRNMKNKNLNQNSHFSQNNIQNDQYYDEKNSLFFHTIYQPSLPFDGITSESLFFHHFLKSLGSEVYQFKQNENNINNSKKNPKNSKNSKNPKNSKNSKNSNNYLIYGEPEKESEYLDPNLLNIDPNEPEFVPQVPINPYSFKKQQFSSFFYFFKKNPLFLKALNVNDPDNNHLYQSLFHDNKITSPLLQFLGVGIIPDSLLDTMHFGEYFYHYFYSFFASRFVDLKEICKEKCSSIFSQKSPTESLTQATRTPPNTPRDIPGLQELIDNDTMSIEEERKKNWENLMQSLDKKYTKKPTEKDFFNYYSQHSNYFLYSYLQKLLEIHIVHMVSSYFVLHKDYVHDCTLLALPPLLLSQKTTTKIQLDNAAISAFQYLPNIHEKLGIIDDFYGLDEGEIWNVGDDFLNQIDQNGGFKNEKKEKNEKNNNISFIPDEHTYTYTEYYYRHGSRFPNGDSRVSRYEQVAKGKDPVTSYLKYFKDQLTQDYNFYATCDTDFYKHFEKILIDLLLPDQINNTKISRKTSYNPIKFGLTPHGHHLLAFMELIGADDRPLNPAAVQQISFSLPLLSQLKISPESYLQHIHYTQHVNKQYLLLLITSIVRNHVNDIRNFISGKNNNYEKNGNNFEHKNTHQGLSLIPFSAPSLDLIPGYKPMLMTGNASTYSGGGGSEHAQSVPHSLLEMCVKVSQRGMNNKKNDQKNGNNSRLNLTKSQQEKGILHDNNDNNNNNNNAMINYIHSILLPMDIDISSIEGDNLILNNNKNVKKKAFLNPHFNAKMLIQKYSQLQSLFNLRNNTYMWLNIDDILALDQFSEQVLKINQYSLDFYRPFFFNDDGNLKSLYLKNNAHLSIGNFDDNFPTKWSHMVINDDMSNSNKLIGLLGKGRVQSDVFWPYNWEKIEKNELKNEQKNEQNELKNELKNLQSDIQQIQNNSILPESNYSSQFSTVPILLTPIKNIGGIISDVCGDTFGWLGDLALSPIQIFFQTKQNSQKKSQTKNNFNNNDQNEKNNFNQNEINEKFFQLDQFDNTFIQPVDNIIGLSEHIDIVHNELFGNDYKM